MDIASVSPKVYLTGSSGLLGSRVQELCGTFELILDMIDLTDVDKIVDFWGRYPQMDAVIHLAAFTDVKRAEEEKDNLEGLCYRLNVEATERIAHLCAEHGQHMIYISTGNVFDGQKYGTYEEDDQPNPLGWYAKTKYLGERAVIESGCSYTIVRIGFPFGRRFEAKLDWIQLMKKKLEMREQLSLFTDQWLSAIWIDDLARILELIVQRGGENQIYHVGTPPVMTPYEVGLMLADVLGIDASLIAKASLREYVETHEDKATLYVKNCSMSTAKFEHAFAFHFSDFATSLRSSVY